MMGNKIIMAGYMEPGFYPSIRLFHYQIIDKKKGKKENWFVSIAL